MEIYEGTVMSFTIEKHWGFIHCPALYDPARPGKDIFFHGKDISNGRAVRKGESVTFNLTKTEAGKPQAVNVTAAGAQDFSQQGTMDGGAWGMTGQPHFPNLAAGLLGIDPEQRYEGTVMSFVLERHWGFLHCSKLFELGLIDGPDRGIFFHEKDVNGPTQALGKGEAVSFTLATNDSGKLQALTVTPLAPQQSAAQTDYSQLYGAAAQSFGAGAQSFGAAAPSFGAAAPISEATQLAEVQKLAGTAGGAPATMQATTMQPASAAPESESNQRFYGEVTSFSQQDGCGFVHCPELTPSYFPENIFFHADDFLTMGDVSRGTLINFTVEQSATASGKPRARQIQHSDQAGSQTGSTMPGLMNDPSQYGQDPAAQYGQDPAAQWASAGTAALNPGAADGKRLVGNVLSWNVEKAWGFVSAPGLEAMVGTGKGIFFHIKDYAQYLQDGSHPMRGMQVSFTYTIDHTGQPRASDVISDGSQGAVGSFPPAAIASPRAAPMGAPGMLGGRQVMSPKPAAVRQAPLGGIGMSAPLGGAMAMAMATVGSSDTRIEGTIMSYNEQKAWGFLTAPGLDSILGAGKGIFFHIKDFISPTGPSPRPGLAVSFAHSLDHNGKYHAHQVMPMEKLAGGTMETPGAGSGSDEARYEGVIQNYNEEKVWGFIGCPALEPMLGPGKGVFFHLKDCFDFKGAVPKQGVAVSFQYTMDSSGRPHASNVLPINAAPQAEASLAPDVMAAVDAAMGLAKRDYSTDAWSTDALSGLPMGGGKRMRWS